MSNVEKWVNRFSGIEYPADEINNCQKELLQDNVVVVYGMSDDLLEFNGVIHDEIGAWNGTKVKITNKPGILSVRENRETLEYNQKEIDEMPTIQVTWEPIDDSGKIFASWLIETRIPHSVFDIMEDGELYCRGVVFDANIVGKI